MSERTNNNVVFARTEHGKKVHIVDEHDTWYARGSHCGISVPIIETDATTEDGDICKSCLKAARVKGVV